MNHALWILQGLLGATFLMSGVVKLVMRRLELAQYAAWATDFSDRTVKLIGLVEVLGGIALVTPWLLGVAPVLTPLAALGLSALMLGAVGTHINRKDGQFAPSLVLALLSAILAWARFYENGFCGPIDLPPSSRYTNSERSSE